MDKKCCYFIGHRDTPDSIYPALCAAIEQHIAAYGVLDFIVGHYGKFDHLAAKALIEAKNLHPEITISLLLPYHPADRAIEKPAGFDEMFYPADMEKVPRRIAIVRANRYAVNYANYLIAYARHAASNARNLVEYAQNRERKGLIKVTLL